MIISGSVYEQVSQPGISVKRPIFLVQALSASLMKTREHSFALCLSPDLISPALQGGAPVSRAFGFRYNQVPGSAAYMVDNGVASKTLKVSSLITVLLHIYASVSAEQAHHQVPSVFSPISTSGSHTAPAGG